nr:probable G-protein coupled receptor Mth-like 10 [Leptinotarsa decemlineata]
MITDDFAIIHGHPGKVFLDRRISQFFLDEKGNFHNKLSGETYPLTQQTYCIEHATKNKAVLNHRYFGIIMDSNPPLQTKFQLNRWTLVVSDIFLVVTMAYYIFAGETRKVFGKTLVSFCLAIFILYALIVFTTFKTKLHYKKNKLLCKIIGFSIIYLGFSCFVWLQIICFDIYWTFSFSTKYPTYTEKRKKEFKRFLSYSLHGWGSPLILTLLMVLFHFVNVLPEVIEIKMGVTKCGIERANGNKTELLFRSIPLTIIQVVNFYLFIKTVLYCLKVKRDIKKMNQTSLNIKKKKKFFARKARFVLVVKLCFTMGIFYLFEVVSSFFDFSTYKVTSIIEIVWDFINSLQGLFIFLIFVCKKKNLVKCKKFSAVEKIRKLSLSGTMTTSLSSVGRKISNVTRRTSKMEVQET